MPRSHCSPRPTPPALVPPDELLDIVAERLVRAHLAEEAPGAALVRLGLTDDGVDLDLRPVPRDTHPVDALVGTTVAPSWAAVGVLAEATARPLDAGPPGPGPGDEPRGQGSEGDGTEVGVVLAVLADRHGHVSHLVTPRSPGPTPAPAGSEAPEGRLVDVLQRALGLATPAPTTPSGPWWATLWLDRVVAALAADPTPHRTLVDLGALHPLIGPGLSARDATVLHRISPAPSRAGWEVMRRAVAATGMPGQADRTIRQALLPLATPAQARWFDQGSFARWLEASLPPRAVLLAVTDALLPSPLARALREAVAE